LLEDKNRLAPIRALIKGQTGPNLKIIKIIFGKFAQLHAKNFVS
jgi:hypothetical protein